MNSDFVPKEKDRPVRQSLCTVLRRNSNLKCLILTFLIHGCLVAIIWCRNTQVTKILLDFDAFPITRTRQVSPCDDGVVYIPTAFVIMLYLLYLVECWHSKARIQLSLPKTGVSTVYRQIQEMREAQPIVWWKAICYHYTRRIRQVTRYRNGASYTSSQVFYERVNSHAMASYFFYTLCGMRDVSPSISDLEKYPATRIKFSKGFIFANVNTAAEFEEQRSTFFQEQGRLDDYMEMRESLELSNSNFKESVIAWANPESLPWFAKNNIFWISSFLLLSWPIRILLELNTAHLNYRVTKLFGINYPSNSSLDRRHHHRPLLFSANYLIPDRQRRTVATMPRLLSSSTLPNVPQRCLFRPIINSTSSQINFQEDEVASQRKKGQAYLTGRRQGSTNILPRSVTLMMFNPSTKDNMHCGKDSGNHHVYLNFESDEDESLIPSYSEALLLMNPRPNQENVAGEEERVPIDSNLGSHAPFTSLGGNANLGERTDNDLLHGESQEQSFNLTSEAESVLANPRLQLEPELPPTYLEALRTSRPVFLPPFTRLRRCSTERDLRRHDQGPHQWLNTTSSYFLQRFNRFRLPIISTGSSSHMDQQRPSSDQGSTRPCAAKEQESSV